MRKPFLLWPTHPELIHTRCKCNHKLLMILQTNIEKKVGRENQSRNGREWWRKESEEKGIKSNEINGKEKWLLNETLRLCDKWWNIFLRGWYYGFVWCNLSFFVICFFSFLSEFFWKNEKYSENRENMRKNEIYLNFYDNNKIYQTIHLKQIIILILHCK